MVNYYTDELIEEIRTGNDIVDVIAEYIRLDKKGKDFFGLCPFHKEKTPSFSVVPVKQIYYCFGCGKGGNVFHFVMNAENLDYVEAIKFLADRARIQLPEGDTKEDIEKARLKQEILKINTEAAKFYFNELGQKKHQNANLYIEKRGIHEGIVKKFGIGYSPETWDGLSQNLIHKGFSEEGILSSGLVGKNKNGGLIDKFRGRIMFPIFDIRGNTIGFGGRVIDNGMPKYINSQETPVYHKGKNLYGLNFAKNAGEKKILVVEGYMDVVSLHQYGITNTVASLGTALTESQGRLLKKYAEEIIISYDADTAGQSATMRGLDLLSDIGCNVKVLIIPQGKDPDEYIRKNGTEEFKILINRALSLVEYKVKILKSQMDTETTDGRIQFLNKISDILARVDNRVEAEMYVKKLAMEYEISEEAIYSEIYKKTKPKSSFRTAMSERKELKKSTKPTDKQLQKEILHDERMLLALICIDNRAYHAVKEKITIEYFIDEDSINAAQIIFDRIESKKGIVPAELLSVLKGDTVGEFAKIIQNECNCEDNYKAVLDIIKRIDTFKQGIRKQEILEALANKESLQEGDVEKLTFELNAIIMKRKN